MATDEGVDGTGVEEGFAAHGGAAGLDKVAVGNGLQHVAGSARGQCREKVLLVVVHGQDEDARLRPGAGKLPGGLQASQPGHGDVEDGQIGLVGAGGFDGFGPVAGFGDNAEVGFALKDETDPPAYQNVVVSQQDADFSRLGHDQLLR